MEASFGGTQAFVLLLFALTIAGLIRYQAHSTRVFGLLLITLYLSALVSTEQLIASVSNTGLLTLMMLMLCSVAIEKTRLLRSLTSFVIDASYKATWLRLYGLTAIFSGLLNNTAVVSTMLAPIRSNRFHSASKLLLPLSYAAILGGTLTLVGTSTNLIVNSLVLDNGMESLHFFDFTLVGLCLVLGCGGLLFFLSSLLPQGQSIPIEPQAYLIGTKVTKDSELVGKSVEENGLRNLESLFLVEIIRDGRLISPVSPEHVIQANDRLLFSGDIKKVTVLAQFQGLSLFADDSGLPLSNLSEVVIRPESRLVGSTLKKSGFRALFDAAVVAIKRDGEAISGKLGDVELRSGDYLALAIGNDFNQRHNLTKNFFMLSNVKTEHLLGGWREKLAVFGFVAAIGLAAIGVTTLFKSVFLFLCVLLLSGALKPNEALQRLPVNIWLIISSALVLSQALNASGVFRWLDYIGTSYSDLITPFAGLVIVYLLSWLLTELVTNNAAAALVFPLALELASSLGANPHAYILAVAFGASASFISPYGYQTNLMVFNAGQYQLKDFVKVGVPIALLYGAIVIATIPLFIGI
ncbi:SLC13 family permease [Paraferrimonas haliotis]|uniref:SLC13 family permease n=1 Tax=Paraferrimonas haliotis TaxID=2013866 RepID=UPI000BA8E0C2|nr:SLC13 family permease [Paraferrimonas haliotis]